MEPKAPEPMTTTSTAWVPGEPAEFGDVPGVAGAMSGEPRAVRGLFVGDRAPAAQEVEVHALVRLQDVVEEHAEVAAGDPVGPRSPRGLAPRDLLVRHPQGQAPLGHAELEIVCRLM